MTLEQQNETALGSRTPKHRSSEQVRDAVLAISVPAQNHTHNPHPLTTYFVAESTKTPETPVTAASTRPAIPEYADVTLRFRFRRIIEVFGNGPDDFDVTPTLQSIRTTKNELHPDERTYMIEHFGQSERFYTKTVEDIICSFDQGPHA